MSVLKRLKKLPRSLPSSGMYDTDITSRLYSKGFDIVFCWLPSHVGIIGNERDSAANKSTVVPVVFQRVFAYHRSQYSRYSAIYTDGSKRADYVGCGVVIEDIMHGYSSTLLAAFSLPKLSPFTVHFNRLQYAP
ncbi:pggt1b [Trichonephila clavipes]|nr:pggt1b [Trichonephila clavipes]